MKHDDLKMQSASDQAEIMSIEEELKNRARQQAAVADLGQLALSSIDLSKLMDEAVKLVTRILNVEYAKVLELLPDGEAMRLLAGVGWKEGYVGQATVGADADSQAGYTLLSHEPVIVEDLRSESRFHGPPLLVEHGVVSGMSVIIQGREHPFGVLGAHTAQKMNFTEDDIHFLNSVANVLAAAIERTTVEEQLRRREAELADFFDNATVGLHWVGPDGIILKVNQTELEMLGYTAQEYVGHPIAEFHVDHDVISDILERLKNAQTLHDYEARLRCKDGTIKHVLINSNVFWENGKFIHTRCFTRDITEGKRVREELIALNNTLEQRVAERTALIRLLQDVAVAANEASSVEAAMQFALDRICEHANWPVGHVYIPVGDPIEQLVSQDIWHLDIPSRFETFRRITEVTKFEPGEGLPGRVCVTGEPAWIMDVTQDSQFPRAKLAEDIGVKAGFAFPILAGKKVVAVLEFFSEKPGEPDEPLLDVMANIGTQLGRVVERNQSEDVLRESEMKFRAVTQSASDAIITADSQGNLVFWNKSAQVTFGYTEEEMLGQPLTRLMPERYRSAHQEGIQRLRSGGQSKVIGKTVELHGLKKNGSEFPLELSLATWQAGEETFYSGIIRDITTRKQVEEQIRESQKQLAEAQQLAHLGSWEWNIPTNKISWSDELYRIYGLIPQDLKPSYEGFLDWVHPDDRNMVREMIEKAFQAHKPFSFEHRIVRPDGSVRILQARGTVVLDETGRPVKMFGTGQDISEQKQAEERIRTLNTELEQRVIERTAQLEAANQDLAAQIVERQRAEAALEKQHAFLRQVIDINPNLIFAKDRAGRFTLVNQAVADIYQTTVEALLGKTEADLDQNTNLVEHYRRRNLEVIETLREKFIPEEVITDVTGKARWLQTVLRPLVGNDGSVDQILGVATDITERKQMEQALHLSRDQLAVILQGVADGITAQDPTGRLIYANDAAARIIGYDSAQSLLEAPNQEIMQKFEILNESGQPLSPDHLPGRLALEGVPDPSITVRFRVTATGEERWSDVKARPVFNEQAKVELAVNIFQDITQLKRVEQRQRILAEAGQVLAASLDYQTTLTSVAQLAVPNLADWCAVVVVQEDGSIRQVAVAHKDPAKIALAQELQQRYPPDWDAPVGVPHVLRTGQSEFYPEITDAQLEAVARDAEHFWILRTLRMNSAMVVPLIARERTVGVITLVWAESGRRYDEADLALAEELARQAAFAVDNAQLYREAQRLNVELEQRVMERTAELQATNTKLEIEIIERKQAEEAVRKSKAMFEGLFESAPDMIVLVNTQGRIVQLNRQVELMFGYRREELRNKPVEVLLPTRFRRRHVEHRFAYNADPRIRPMGAGLELFARRKDGSEFSVDITLSPLETTEAGTLVISVVRDITERKQAEKALRESEARFRTVFEGAGIGISLLDLEGRLTASNPAFYQMLGYSIEELSKMSFADYTHPDDVKGNKELFQELAAGKRDFYRLEKRYIRKDGDLVWGSLTVSLVRGSAGEPYFAISMVKDITERKQMEAELAEVQHRLMESREAERLHLARELHDGPVQDLYGVSYQLNEVWEALADDVSRGQLITTQVTVQRTIQMLRSLCGELRPPTLAPFGLEKAIRSHAEQFQQAHPELDIRLDLMADGKALPEQVRLALYRVYQQALANIIRHAEAHRVLVHFELKPEEIILEIEDDGCGFELPERRVELARRGHLGLVGATERTKAIGGELTIISAPGEGTVIQAVVPRSNELKQT